MNGKISKESWLIKMIKQIISDLDGTLLNGQHILDESDSRLLEELQRKGIAFAVASGRSYDSAKGIVGRYGLQCDYIILNGAAVCSDAGELLDEVPFSKEQLPSHSVSYISTQVLTKQKYVKLFRLQKKSNFFA